MSDTFIPAYLSEVTINAGNVSTIGNVVSIDETYNELQRKTFGRAYSFSGSGQSNLRFSVSGLITAEKAEALRTALTTREVTCTWQIGTASAGTDAGEYSLLGTVLRYNISGSVGSDVAWSMDIAQADQAVVYTAGPNSASA